MNTKLVPETVYHIKFHIKTYLQSFVSIYHLYHFLESFTKVFFATLASHWTTVSSLKPLISGVTLSENAPSIPCIPSCNMIYLRYCFSFLPVSTTFEVTSCVFRLKCFNYYTDLVPLPYLLLHYIGWYNHMETKKGWIVTTK